MRWSQTIVCSACACIAGVHAHDTHMVSSTQFEGLNSYLRGMTQVVKNDEDTIMKTNYVMDQAERALTEERADPSKRKEVRDLLNAAKNFEQKALKSEEASLRVARQGSASTPVIADESKTVMLDTTALTASAGRLKDDKLRLLKETEVARRRVAEALKQDHASDVVQGEVGKLLDGVVHLERRSVSRDAHHAHHRKHFRHAKVRTERLETADEAVNVDRLERKNAQLRATKGHLEAEVKDLLKKKVLVEEERKLESENQELNKEIAVLRHNMNVTL